MAYLGTPPRSRVLSSSDIGTGAVTLDDISFTDQPTNLSISGTIDKHTMRLADGVTVVGDVTLSDNLILSKISDDGNAITLTNDSSTRTITGTGSLEASTLTQTPNASLTGMTGELGSVVTGSPNLNLGNATQFPAGHVIQTRTTTTESNASTGNYSQTMSDSWATIDLGGDLLYSGFTATNGNTLVFTLGGFAGRCTPKDLTYRIELSLWRGSTNIGGINRFVGGTADYRIPLDFVLVIENCQSFSNQTITAKAKRESGGGFTSTYYLNANGNHGSGGTYGGPRLPFLMIQEIQA